MITELNELSDIGDEFGKTIRKQNSLTKSVRLFC